MKLDESLTVGLTLSRSCLGGDRASPHGLKQLSTRPATTTWPISFERPMAHRRTSSASNEWPRDIPATMKAAAVDRFGPPSALTLHDLPVPRPGPHEVLIAIDTAGIGSWDASIRDGSWRKPGRARFPLVPGVDGAGIVVARGARVRRIQLGDRVGWIGNTSGTVWCCRCTGTVTERMRHLSVASHSRCPCHPGCRRDRPSSRSPCRPARMAGKPSKHVGQLSVSR